jgi:hypothetical protein
MKTGRPGISADFFGSPPSLLSTPKDAVRGLLWQCRYESRQSWNGLRRQTGSNCLRKLLPLQLRLRLCRAAGSIRPYAKSGIALHQQMIRRLAVLPCGIGDMTAPHRFVPPPHVHMVLAAAM